MKWVEMWVKRRQVIDYNMRDLYILSCRTFKRSMRAMQHIRFCDYQGATKTLQRHSEAELPQEKAHPSN